MDKKKENTKALNDEALDNVNGGVSNTLKTSERLIVPILEDGVNVTCSKCGKLCYVPPSHDDPYVCSNCRWS